MVRSVSYPSWEKLFVLNHIACLGETSSLLVDLGYPMVKLLRSRIQKEKNVLPKVFRGAFFLDISAKQKPGVADMVCLLTLARFSGLGALQVWNPQGLEVQIVWI